MKTRRFSAVQFVIIAAVATFFVVTAVLAEEPYIQDTTSQEAKAIDSSVFEKHRHRVRVVRCDRGRKCQRRLQMSQAEPSRSVTVNQNVGSGVSIINDSRLQIFSFPEAQGSSITADSNGFAGVGRPGAELSVVGSQFFGSGANVISVSNNFVGFFMPAGEIVSPHATAKFNVTNNVFGLLMEDNANVLIIGGLNVTENGTGVIANGAGTVHVVSVPPNPSTIKVNRTDIDLSFGSRATLERVVFDTLQCDDTILVRGTLVVDDGDVVCTET